MISLKQASEIVKKHNPDMRPNSCLELENHYSFSMVPKDLAPGDGFANSSVYLVDKKTGQHRVAYFMEIMSEPVIRRFERSEL